MERTPQLKFDMVEVLQLIGYDMLHSVIAMQCISFYIFGLVHRVLFEKIFTDGV